MRKILLIIFFTVHNFADINEEFINAIKQSNYAPLLTTNFNIYYQNKDGDNFLSLAAYYGHEDLVRYLLSKGLSADFKETNGTTPLMNAAFKGHLNIVKLLASNGADLNAKNIYLYTPLIKSIYGNHTDTVFYLLSNNVNINHRDAMGNTALHYAVAYHQHPEILLELIKKSNLAISNKKKITAFDIAINNKETSTIELFLAHNSNLVTKLSNYSCLDQLVYNTTVSNNQPLLKSLLEIGGNVAAVNIDSIPMIHGSVSLGLKDMVIFLLNHGANIEQTSPYGDTPLTMAVYAEEFDIVEYLINYGANINHRETNGDTSLHIAVRRKNKEITKLLLSQPNIELNVKNIYGETPLDIAKESNDPELFLIINNAVKQNIEDKNYDSNSKN
ncbi:MAG: ankyrin repeat domain-containing protein [Brevinema sp.]